MGQATDDDDFSEEIQDIESVQVDTPETEENIFSIQTGEDSYWFGSKRQARKLAQHHRCCFGINHWCCLEDHQLYMFDVVMKVNQDEETNSLMEDVGATSNREDEILKTINGKQTLKRKIPKYYDRQ
jgi:hypothetical protein